MKQSNEENKILALIPAARYDIQQSYKEATQRSPGICTLITKKTEEKETQNTTKSEKEQELSILPCFLHIVTCYLTIVKSDHINKFIDYVKDKCNHIDSMGLDGPCILRNIKRKMQRFLEFTKQHNDVVHQNMNWFQQRLFDIYVTCNPYNYKTTAAPRITTKFRPLCPILTTEAKIDESREEFDNNTISNIVVIQGGILTYYRHCMRICCMTRDGESNEVHCPSSVTDFTRIGEGTVLGTLPFKQMILIINAGSIIIKTLPLGFYKVSYLERHTFIGIELFSNTIYLVDWVDNKIVRQFIAKEVPTDIAVGVGNKLLLSFSNINRVVCYNLDGQQLFEVETNSMDLVTNISVYRNHFYVLQGYILYRISATGGVTKRDIGRKCRYISVGTNSILVTDYFGVPHMITTNKDFWFRLSYNYQLHTPSLNNHLHIEGSYNIINILPMSTSSVLITYRNKKSILFTDTGEVISQNGLTYLVLPSIFCRINSNRFLVFYREMKGLQHITCPELIKGPLIKVQTDYMNICHIVLNKCLALTTSENKNEVHLLLIKEDKVDIIERISLEHYNVTIAATPINFVVVDGRKNMLVFYSACGEEPFEKYLPFYGYPHHIYSDNLYFYVLFKRHSILICYDIYGEIKWQWKLPFPVHPHIAVFQGTLYVPDVELNRVLLYKYYDKSSGCCLHPESPYIRNLNLRLKEKENDKVLISEICHLANGQLVVSDISHDCLLYISNEGDIVSRLSLPSTATDICRWDSHQIGVTLPLQKQLRVIGNLSKTVRSVSLRQPYVRVCKMGEGEIVCYCDKPSHLDILAIKNNYNTVEIIHKINIPFGVKSLSMEKETLKLLIVTKGNAFQYNTTISGGGHNGGFRDLCRIKMVPNVLLSQVKRPPNLYSGSIDQTYVYLIDDSRTFAINDYNLLVNDLVTNNQLNYYIDLVDVFSRNISVSEMLSSSLYIQDLTVSDKARHINIPEHLGDKKPVKITSLVITENNLIAAWDKDNKNIKLFTLDGQLLDSVKLNLDEEIKMCRWQSNTLVITTMDYNIKYQPWYQLWTLKVEFPVSLVSYLTRNEYNCIDSLSNNQLVCSNRCNPRRLYVIYIDAINSTVNEIKKLHIPASLLPMNKYGENYINYIFDITVTADDVIIVFNNTFIIFFNSDGQYLHSLRHYTGFSKCNNSITNDDGYLYMHGPWIRYVDISKCKNVVRLTQAGEYNRIFLNARIYRHYVQFFSINCKGPRFVGGYLNKLYVEGLFMLNRESFPVSRLQIDDCPVQVKDIDISDEGKTVVCEKANTGNIKIFDEDGELLCYGNVASLVGGVCFTHERDIMATVPKRKQIFQLNGKYLQKSKVWPSVIPYGVIWRKVEDIYWCVHMELIECHCIKIDGDQLNILESMSLLNLDSGLHFPSITSQMNKEIFSNELINEFKCSEGEGGRRRDKSGEIIGKSRLKVRRGNYIAESKSGTDKISVRRLPHRTTMVPFSIPSFHEPVNFDFRDIRDWNSKLIKLDDNASVLMFRDTVTLINTTTGDIFQHKQLPQQQQQQQQPLDICRWTDELFIVDFGKEMMVFNRDLCRLKTIQTEKYYNTIYKYNDNQLVCGGCHYIRDIDQDERGNNYQGVNYCINQYIEDIYWYSYYVDVVDMNDGKCKDEVCRGMTRIRGKLEQDMMMSDIVVTSFGDIVFVKRGGMDERMNENYCCFVYWYRRNLLVRRTELQRECFSDCYIYRPFLTTICDDVYIIDSRNNIYQMPRCIENQKPGYIEHQTYEDIQKYLLLSGYDNEVFQVFGFDISQNSFMVFGIIPGRQSFAIFHYDR